MTADPGTTLAAHFVEVRALAGSTSPRQFRAVCLGCEWGQEERTDRDTAVSNGAAHQLAMLADARWVLIPAELITRGLGSVGSKMPLTVVGAAARADIKAAAEKGTVR